jgi:hypothetical protein
MKEEEKERARERGRKTAAKKRKPPSHGRDERDNALTLA